MGFRDLFPSKDEREARRLASIANRPNASGLSDAELIRQMAKGAITGPKKPASPAVPAPATSVDMPAAHEDGIEKLETALSPRLLEYINLSSRLSEMLQIDMRPGHGDKGLLDFMGFNREFTIKYFQAIFGSFGNSNLNTTEGTKKLVQSGSFIDALYYDAMSLDDHSSPNQIKRNVDILSETMAKLRQIKDFKTDLDSVEKLITIIEEKEAERRNSSNKHLSYGEIMELAEEMPELKQALKKKDLSELNTEIDKIIAENTGKARTVMVPVTTGAPTPRPRPSAAPVQVLDLGRFEREADVELSHAIGRLGRLYEHCRSLGKDERLKIYSAINHTDVSMGNMLGIKFYNPTEPNILQLLVDHFKITSDTELAAKIMEIDTEFQAKNIFKLQNTPAAAPASEAQTVVFRYEPMKTRELSKPEVFAAMTKLQILFAGLKAVGASEREDVRVKVESTTMGKNGNLAEKFCDGQADDVIQLLASHFGAKTDNELEPLILAMANQFTDAGILTK